MGDVVNLNRFRKAKARSTAESKAAENRARFGRPGAERRLEDAVDRIERRRHESHRLERPEGEEPETP
jgi:hypothetical protein